MRKLIHQELLDRRLDPAEVPGVRRHPVVGVLENIRSMYNIGSCFRTADAMLLERLVLTGYTSTPPRKEILKTALGATETVPWQHEESTIDAIETLRAEGYRIYALELTDSSTPIDRIDAMDFPAAIVLGNELNGVSQDVLDHCDQAIEIPMYGVKHSLNVAVAFGVAAWECVRRLRKIPRGSS
jgi:tRNA G18 (ribose-2'-O)-methylase SpoU